MTVTGKEKDPSVAILVEAYEDNESVGTALFMVTVFDTGVAAVYTWSTEAAKETVIVVVPDPTIATCPVDELIVAILASLPLME